MIKYVLKTLLFVFLLHPLAAQTKDEKKYNERALEVQDEIWNNSEKAFGIKEAPDKYKNESAVILAKSFEVTNSFKRKFKMVTIFGGTVKQYHYFTTLRERVLIKDKTALEDFSTLNYKKIVDNTDRSNIILHFLKTSKTFIGAKIFKASGKVISINPNEEEVLTKNESKEKEGKIAIPDLQTGDILDFYIRIEEVVEAEANTRGPDLFFLGGEYPILYYDVKYVLDRKCGADIMNMNGAKPMSERINDDKDIEIEFIETDLPKITNTLWTSTPRQIPYHVVRYGFSGAKIAAGTGEVKRGPFTDLYKNKLKDIFIDQIRARVIDFSPENNMEEYFGSRKKMKGLPADSIVNYLYNFYHWMEYGSFFNMDVSNERNTNAMKWYNLSVTFSEILRDYNIENDIVIVCNRFSGRLKEIFGIGDFETIVKVNSGGKYIWICFNDFFQNTGQLASVYQGEDALILTREGKDRKPKFADAETPIKLPVAKSSENVLLEDLKVNFLKDNPQTIQVERKIIETGSMKQTDQKSLLLAEEVEANFAALVNKKRSTEKMAENKKQRAKAEEIQTAMDKERVKQKDYFKNEIKTQYGQEVKELLAYKILNTGLSVYTPAFEFTQTFTMDNFVKKAGNNYIFDAGRLMGEYKKIEEKERIRKLDIYMSSARKLSYSFSLNIPEGYSAKGVEELNKKIENDAGSFVSTGNLDGNTVTITVSRTYFNNFEPAANWPKLLAVMDAAADFTGMKILLEKKK